MKHIKQIIFLLLISISSSLFAQEQLSLGQAVEIGLKNNFSIQVAKNNAEIDKNNTSAGNAGMLPEINLNVSTNNATVNTQQIFVSGQETNRKNAKSQGVATGLALNWTLFDGLGMFVSYERLKQIGDMGELNTKVAIETSVENIINTYYNIVRQKQLLKVIENAMSISGERVKISETKFNLGAESKLSFLQAKVDYNADKSASMKQKIVLNNFKITLNELLGRETSTKFEVTDTIIISFKPAYEELKGIVLKQNVSLLQADKEIRLANLELRGIEAMRYPRIDLNANYNFSQSRSEAGFLLSNQSIGPSFGFTATVPLFNGFNLNRQSKNAKISVLNSNLQYDQVKNQLDAAVTRAFNDFQNQLEILTLEEENIKTARENIRAVMERFRLGNISSIEVKEAQRSFVEAENRYVTALYDAKTAETALKKMCGNFVK